MNPYRNGNRLAEQEQEWELQEASHSPQSQFEGEWEAENEYFFKRKLGSIQKVARASAPIAKQLAPIAARTLIGRTSSPLARSLLNSLLQAGEQSAVTMEAQLFGSNPFGSNPFGSNAAEAEVGNTEVAYEAALAEVCSNAAEAEVGNTEVAYEAALAEVLAAEASHSGSDSEAEAFLGAALPGIIKSMGGQGVLRPVMPNLVSGNARLVRLLHDKGPSGRRLLRLVPTIVRRTTASLKNAHQTGQPITSDLALRLMADHTSQVLSNPQAVTRGIVRNAMIQKRTTRQPI